MMKKVIWPSVVNGVVSAPPSKSVAQRAIALAALAAGKSVIYDSGDSDDVLAATGVIEALGAEVCRKDNSLHIIGGRLNPQRVLHCGESGLCLRMFAGIAAALDGEMTLTGCGSLLKRPLNDVPKALSALGVKCHSNKGFLPLTISSGPMCGRRYIIDASNSSQLLSGLLMAAPLLKTDTSLVVEKLVSKPYVELTIDVMRAFSVQIINKGFREFLIKAGQKYEPAVFHVEGDWSGAAFMLVAGSVAGGSTVQKLNNESLQADKKIMGVLAAVGARCKHSVNSCRVSRHQLKAFDFDATDCPDLFPPLVALAANCKGDSRIAGVGRLHDKESNRAESLAETFSKLGIKVRTEKDAMIVRGGKVTGSTVSAHGDHRIAMAAAIAALTADGPVTIIGADAVNKSYPDFFADLERIAPRVKAETP